MQALERRVICTLEKKYSFEKEEKIGRLNVLFELLPDGNVSPVNQLEIFCETGQVFVTSGFNEIRERFNDAIFETKCKPTSFEHRDGECRYVSNSSSCEDIRGIMVAQLFKMPLPNILHPVIILSEAPQTKIIFLEDDKFIYGPFSYELNDKNIGKQHILTLASITTPINKIPPFHIAKINKEKVNNHISVNIRQGTFFLGNIKYIIENNDDIIDFISNEQIISTYGNKIAQNSNIRNFSKGTITQIRKHYSSTIEYKTFPQRFKRLFQCLEDAETWDNSRKELFDDFLSSEKGKNILKKYIEDNKEHYFKDEKKLYIEKLKKDTLDKEKYLKQLQLDNKKLEQEIRKKIRERDQFEDGSNFLTKKERNELEQSFFKKEKELEELNKKLSSLELKYYHLNTIDKLKKEINNLERDRDNYRDRKKDMNAQLNDVEKRLKENNESLIGKLLEFKPYVDTLCGIRPKSPVKSLDYKVNIRKLDSDANIEDLREKLIDTVLDSLDNQGRKIDYYTAANLLTTIAQSQFTLFSGLPGTGKTSLAKMLGISLGLKNRFLNIPIARGWTSYRDILGFYNALSQSYVSASSGLFELLKYLHMEQKEQIDGALSIILLDEFNLSQPEHYFSQFMEMADPESKRELSTGDPDEPYFIIPEYLRFLGTLNQDESVQILTPRLLDRAAIINFDEFESDYEFLEFGTKKEYSVEPISGKKFIELFQPSSLDMPSDIENTLKNIIDILKKDSPDLGIPINISYRKIKSIRSYHNVVGPMMSTQSRYTAFDYAVSQHLIPLLNGYGSQFGKRLEKLEKELPDEMEKSRKYLNKLINYGNQNMFNYGMSL